MISVIIPTYNRAALLVEFIKAIQKQSYAVREIIVVDDGSTDDTQIAVSTLGGPITYLYQRNAGKSVALNNGLAHSTGNYIWICDDDDIALPRAAEFLIGALKNSSGAGFAFGRFKRFAVDPKTRKEQIYEPVYWPDLDNTSLLVALLLDCFIFQNASLYRREVLDAAGPFRTDLLRSQDYEMTVRLVCRFDAVYVPELMFLQRIDASEFDRLEVRKRMEKWLHYDAIFFRELYETIPLACFAPKSLANADPEIRERAALLQRACIFWRRKLFDLSLTDLKEAIGKGNSKCLTSSDEAICGDFIHAKFGSDELTTESELVEKIYSFAAQNEYGCSVIKTITSPVLWFVRQSALQRQWHQCAAFIKILVKIHGYVGIATLIESSIRRRIRRHKWWRKARGVVAPERKLRFGHALEIRPRFREL